MGHWIVPKNKYANNGHNNKQELDLSFHKTIALIRLGQDVELTHSASGVVIASFTGAVTEKYNNQETTTWYRCKCFKKTAELASEYLAKGSQALVEGKMQFSTYDKKDGSKGYSSDLIVNNITFVGAKVEKQGGASAQDISTETAFTSDDIPFMRSELEWV